MAVAQPHTWRYTRPARFIGSTLFSIFFIVWIITLAILYLPLLLFPAHLLKKPVQFWGRGVLAALKLLIGIDYKIVGRKNLPKAPCILAAKHQSTFETIALYTNIDQLVVVLKQELLWIPIYGWYVAKSKMVPIIRGSGTKALKRIVKHGKQAIQNKNHILIFPEGTRVKPTEQKVYHAGVVALYKHLNCPVVPISLNSGLFWGKRQFLKSPGQIIIQLHAPIKPGLPKDQFIDKLKHTIEQETNKLCRT